MTVGIRGLQVSLRPVAPADYPLLVAWQNDSEIARWMDYRTPFTLRDVDDDQTRAAREGRPFVIELDGRPVGKCGLNQFRDAPRTCSLYIYVGDRGVWSRGVGRDTLMTLLALAFDELGMERVELTVLTDNRRAVRVYEACGFVQQSVLRGRSYGGRWLETAVMSVLRDEFKRIRTNYGI